MAEIQEPIPMDAAAAAAPAADAPAEVAVKPAPAPTRKRPRDDADPKVRGKSRSVFSQMQKSLLAAKEDVTKAKQKDLVKNRMAIDTRVMGEITRKQTEVRKQDEARRDRITANRKEEDLDIKETIMKLRHSEFPRLAGFLRTGDFVDPTDIGRTAQPKAVLNHPPPFTNPPQLYYLPAILTPAQKKFLEASKLSAANKVKSEQSAWEAEKKAGQEEIEKLRKKVAEAEAEAAAAALAAKKDAPPDSAAPPASATTANEDQMEIEETPVVAQTELPEARPVDNEDAIEY